MDVNPHTYRSMNLIKEFGIISRIFVGFVATVYFTSWLRNRQERQSFSIVNSTLEDLFCLL
jgi:hypothetical protein